MVTRVVNMSDMETDSLDAAVRAILLFDVEEGDPKLVNAYQFLSEAPTSDVLHLLRLYAVEAETRAQHSDDVADLRDRAITEIHGLAADPSTPLTDRDLVQAALEDIGTDEILQYAESVGQVSRLMATLPELELPADFVFAHLAEFVFADPLALHLKQLLLAIPQDNEQLERLFAFIETLATEGQYSEDLVADTLCQCFIDLALPDERFLIEAAKRFMGATTTELMDESVNEHDRDAPRSAENPASPKTAQRTPARRGRRRGAVG